MARILIVDDEELSIDVPREILSRAHHEILTARNGVSALELYKRESPDLVVTDIIMPEMNGLDLIENLRLADPEA